MFPRKLPSILGAILFAEQAIDDQLTTPIQSMRGGLVLDPESVVKVNAVLAKLGIGPIGEEGFIKHTNDDASNLSNDNTSLLEIVIDNDEAHPIDRINTAGGGGKTTKDVAISPEALELARKFYIAGKRGENWYYDAAKTLHEGFEDEQELTLFTLLLAATSVQNEIYGNLIEAGAMFNAIMADMRENVDLLERFVSDSKAIGMDMKGIKQTEYASLHIYQTVVKSKIINIAAKMGNIAKAISLMFSNRLDRNTVIALISNSVDLTVPNTNFDARSPFFRKLKIANYALTLLDPEYASTDQNPFNVVVDTWMIRAFYPGKTKKDQISLLSNERAYAEIAKAVAQMADEAGVSPHAMQAAIWLGIREQTASELGGEPDYIAALQKLVDGYADLWAGIDKETMTLRDVIKRLDSTVAATALQDKRADWMRNIVKQTQEKKRKAKLLAASKAGQGNLPF